MIGVSLKGGGSGRKYSIRNTFLIKFVTLAIGYLCILKSCTAPSKFNILERKAMFIDWYRKHSFLIPTMIELSLSDAISLPEKLKSTRFLAIHYVRNRLCMPLH